MTATWERVDVMAKIISAEVGKLLEQLSTIVDELVEQAQSNPIDSESDLQLREISKAIERLDSSGVSIPSALLEEKSRILNIVGNHRRYQDIVKTIYNKLNDLVLRLRDVTTTRNRGNTDGNLTQDKTPWRVVARAVIDTLRQQQRQMRRAEIWEAFFNIIQDRMLAGDFEPAQHNGRPFWKNSVSRVLYNLRKENILKPAKQHGYHELEEVYYENQTPFD